MKKNKVLLMSFFICLFVPNAFGQNGKNDPSNQGNNIYEPPPWAASIERARRKMDEQHGRDKNGMIIQPRAERRSVPPVSAEEKEIFEENRKNYEITLKRLQPPAIYFEKYESFLKNSKTGLARLFVDKNCDAGKTVSVQQLERCGDVIPVKGGGSYYSFRFGRNNYYARDWWDIHFIDDKFAAGNDSVQTVITEIGAVGLQDINIKSKAFAFLKNYKPKQTLAEIKEENKILQKGIEFNNFTYSNSVAVKLNSTYVLRSVAYLLAKETKFNNAGRGIDSFVAFQVVGREKDGSLVILWRELKTELPRRELK